MKRLLAIFLISTCLICHGQGQTTNTANVTWNLSDFTAFPSAVVRFGVKPTAPYGTNATNIMFPTEISETTGVNGSVTISNLATGYTYVCTLYGGDDQTVVLGKITNSFAASVTGNINANGYLGGSNSLAYGFYFPTNLYDSLLAGLGISFATDNYGDLIINGPTNVTNAKFASNVASGIDITNATLSDGLGDLLIYQGPGLPSVFVDLSNNVCVGSQSLSPSIGTGQTAVGNNALGEATTASRYNTGIGFNAFTFLLAGSNNIGLGSGAGLNYSGAESSNIDIGNPGVTGESLVTRIGTAQTQCFIAGQVNANGGGISNVPSTNLVGNLPANVLVSTAVGGFLMSSTLASSGSYLPFYPTGTAFQTTEIKAECPVLAGTYSNLFIGMYSASAIGAGTNFTATAYTNGVASAVTFTSATSTGGGGWIWGHDSAHSFTANTNGVTVSIMISGNNATPATGLSWSWCMQKVN